MDKSRYTEITNAAYKIIDFFPEEDILQNKAKEKALAILENLVLLSIPEWSFKKPKAALEVLRDIDVLIEYLELAKAKGWVQEMNLAIISKEYDKIREELKPLAQLSQNMVQAGPVDNPVKSPKPKAQKQVALTERQEKIIEILSSQEKVQVSDLKNIMPEVTKRTLRRDLDDLLKKEKILRTGEFNQVFYQIRKQVPEPQNQDLG